MYVIKITPLGKPRQTQADRWKKRPCVVRYRAFADRLRWQIRHYEPLLKNTVLQGAAILYVLPMPRSWSMKKKRTMDGHPHLQKPDLSNLTKAFEDALFANDSAIHMMAGRKIWGYEGRIEVTHFEWRDQYGESTEPPEGNSLR